MNIMIGSDLKIYLDNENRVLVFIHKLLKREHMEDRVDISECGSTLIIDADYSDTLYLLFKFTCYDDVTLN